MRRLQCLLLAALLGGIAGSTPVDAAPTVLVEDTAEDLKKDIADARKAGALTETQALEFTQRAHDIASEAQDASSRCSTAGLVFALRLREASPALEKARGELWDLLISKDVDELTAFEPLVARFLKDKERAAAIGKQTKLPELKATCAWVPLSLLMGNDERTEKETKELLAGLKALEKEFGKVVDPRRKRTWSELCADYTFQVEHLSIGSVAPEIEANDTSGVKFKLSDYRGKVVLLDFWGHW
jgi:hypothetical protein